MQIFYTKKFLRQYKKLPAKIRNHAEAAEEIFRSNPFHSGLNTHKLKGKLNDFWSFSINFQYRIIFEFIDKGDVSFLLIGKHDIYH